MQVVRKMGHRLGMGNTLVFVTGSKVFVTKS